jgi:site-specific DNA recombinase
MRRAALYARVSTELQEQERTIESQLAAITRHADRHGLRHTPALTYTDDGYSGSWLDRPALDELRDHAREGRFDVVVVLCPDRLARRYAYQVLLLEELKQAGVEVHFCERPINDSPDDQLLLQIQGAIAEYERAKILERSRRGRLHQARRGELPSPTVPYGYHYAARKYGGDGKIRIDTEEAAMVRQLFEWYAAEGTCLDEVLRRLNASSWKTRHGKNEWCFGTVRAMLSCEWYVGRAYYNRTTRERRPPRQEGEDRSQGKVVREKPRSEWILIPVPRITDDRLFARRRSVVRPGAGADASESALRQASASPQTHLPAARSAQVRPLRLRAGRFHPGLSLEVRRTGRVHLLHVHPTVSAAQRPDGGLPE